MRLLIIIFGLVFWVACKEKEYTPRVIYETPKRVTKQADQDKDLLIADLPINFPELNYLFHPIGKLRDFGGRSKDYQSGSYSYNISNYGESEITGEFYNILIQTIGQDTLIPLLQTNKLITQVGFLKAHYLKTQEAILLCGIHDNDSNQNGILDNKDLKALYLKKIGDSIQKLSPDFMEWIDHTYLPSLRRLYFRCVVDTNKNGIIEKSDQVHYFYLNISEKPWRVVEYFP